MNDEKNKQAEAEERPGKKANYVNQDAGQEYIGKGGRQLFKKKFWENSHSPAIGLFSNPSVD